MSDFFHSCAVHLCTIKSHLLSNECTIKYSKKNVKICIKIKILRCTVNYLIVHPLDNKWDLIYVGLESLQCQWSSKWVWPSLEIKGTL